MKIVILSGGTGSIQLQRGIYSVFNGISDGLDIKVLVNAYDNGLSTGLVRKVCGGNILGPSDVRKNQTLIHEIYYGNTPLLKVLNIRFSIPAHDAKAYVIEQIKGLYGQIGQQKTDVLLAGANEFFENENSRLIDYDDFSLSNIIYAGLAAMHDNSLRTAAAIMSEILDIPDNVILNSDESLFLKALSQSGKLIDDEGDIVAWSNAADPIKSIFFQDAKGKEKLPVLCNEARDALMEADMIISSSGTQWSSLIPTYITTGFKDAYESASAKKFLVMNKTQDKDMLGITASQVCDIISQFMSLTETEIIVDTSGDTLLNSVEAAYEKGTVKQGLYFPFTPSNPSEANTKHNPESLAKFIFTHYFGKEILHASTFVFDYDDTLVGRGNSYTEASQFNKDALISLREIAGKNIVIVTGNNIRAVNMFVDRGSCSAAFEGLYSELNGTIQVYADGGLNRWDVNAFTKYDPSSGAIPWTFKSTLDDSLLFSKDQFDDVCEVIKSIGIPSVKIENRHYATISIKPIDKDYRFAVRMLLAKLLPDYKVCATGRTTIDITKFGADKSIAVKEFVAAGINDIVYIGDEIDDGNDAPFVKKAEQENVLRGIIKVNNPADTAIFLRTARFNLIASRG